VGAAARSRRDRQRRAYPQPGRFTARWALVAVGLVLVATACADSNPPDTTTRQTSLPTESEAPQPPVVESVAEPEPVVLLEVPSPLTDVGEPVESVFTAVSAGGSHSCGLRGDATVTCWGRNDHGGARPPGGSFTAVSAGGSHSCGVRTNATIVCWGDWRGGRLDVPAGTFTAISTAGRHSCALRINATIACWGNNAAGQSDAPVGTYIAVAAGRSHSCALRSDHTVTCWGGVATDLRGDNDT